MAVPAILREIRRKTFQKPQKLLKHREDPSTHTTSFQRLYDVVCLLGYCITRVSPCKMQVCSNLTGTLYKLCIRFASQAPEGLMT